MASYWKWPVVVAALLVASCGGGGGGTGASTSLSGGPPTILASVASFPAQAVPPAVLPAGANTLATVQVLSAEGGVPVTNATVSVNGTALVYSALYQVYQGALNLAPGASVNLSVNDGIASYTASGSQANTFPQIVTPQGGTVWDGATSNLVSWSGTVPSAGAQFAVGVLSQFGNLVWPATGTFQLLPASASSVTIGADSLSAGNLYVLVGVGTEVGIADTNANSGLVISQVTAAGVTVTVGVPPTLVSVTVTPAMPTLSPGGTQQFSATATYADQSTRDVTTQVTWRSSDTSKATIAPGGLATAVAAGSATITASIGTISGSSTLSVFVPVPSPPLPLGQSVAYQIDYAHTGYASLATPLTFPATPTWSKTLSGAAGYPLIAGGKVYVLTVGTPSAHDVLLNALNEADGSTAFGPIAITGTYAWAAFAYDNGALFVINSDGLLTAIQASSGQTLWSEKLPGGTSFDAAPTAANGVVYVGGYGDVSGILYAVDQLTGAVLWTANFDSAGGSSPAVSANGVFVSYACEVDDFAPYSGASLWHYNGGCTGGGGSTPALANSELYARNLGITSNLNLIFDGGTGNDLGSFQAARIPAFNTTTGFFLANGSPPTLSAMTLASKAVAWTFSGDGQLVSAPIVVNDKVIVGSASGVVYALDANTGATVWTGNAGAPIAAPDEINLAVLTGLGAGEGYLVVPAGSTITAWRLSP